MTIDLLEANGPLLREPYSKHIQNGLFELQTKQGSILPEFSTSFL